MLTGGWSVDPPFSYEEKARGLQHWTGLDVELLGQDVVRSEPEIFVLKGELYPEIAVVWGAILSLYMLWQTRQLDADGIMLGVGVTFAGAFLTRIATIQYGFRSPRFAAPSR